MPSASSDHCPLRPGGTDRPGRAQALCAPPGPPRSRWPRVRHRPPADRLSPARGAAGPSGAGAPGRLSSRTRRGLRKEARAGGTSAAADSGLTPTSGDGGVQTPRSRRRCPSHPLACRSRRGLPLGPSAALAGPGPGEAGESHSLPWLPAFYVRGRRPLFALCGCHRGVIVGWPWGPRCVTHALSHVQPGSLFPRPRRGSEVLAPREGPRPRPAGSRRFRATVRCRRCRLLPGQPARGLWADGAGEGRDEHLVGPHSRFGSDPGSRDLSVTSSVSRPRHRPSPPGRASQTPAGVPAAHAGRAQAGPREPRQRRSRLSRLCRVWRWPLFSGSCQQLRTHFGLVYFIFGVRSFLKN